MPQANFAYAGAANDRGALALTVSIFADRAHLRALIREDAEAAGFRLGQVAGIAALLEGDALPLGEVILVDCAEADITALAALSRLDMRAANSGAQLIVSTSLAALDDVFACTDQSQPQLLVDPSRAERVIALGRVLAQFPSLRVRELGEEDRLMLLRLTEQVGQIAERLGRIEPLRPTRDGADQVEAPRSSFSGQDGGEGGRLARSARPPLPDPRLIRRIIRQRQQRTRYFDVDLFADPAWDMLLDLTAARAEHTRVSVTSLCIAAAVPPTTALRWIGQMIETGLFLRVEDDTDRRRAFITLTDQAADAMARYFAEVDMTGGSMV